uniref:Uncharacterized protein n=1 Tax=Anguilla anguilla TaxID=7936 RepID=A0A0E9VHH2_ANGAN
MTQNNISCSDPRLKHFTWSAPEILHCYFLGTQEHRHFNPRERGAAIVP